MSNGPRLPLVKAAALALRIRDAIADCCERIEIVGSIRRQQPDVGDIELLLIPKTQQTPDGLFGMRETSLLTPRLDQLVADGKLRRENNGATHLRFGIMSTAPYPCGLDIFISNADRWGVEMVVRTGPAAFSKSLVTARAFGGMLPDGYRIGDGWRLKRGDETLSTPDERSVFDAIGAAWLEPNQRDGI